MGRETDALKKWLGPLGKSLPEVFVVGGAVRDHLLGREVRDIDLMCPEPEDLARRLQAVHDVARVPFLKKPGAPCIRVVNRRDTEDFIDLVPIHGGSLEQDLTRRDFTINAMAMRVMPGGVAGEVVDPLGGRGDLERGVIRAAGPRAFLEDPLRVVRASRFSAELSFQIDPQTIGLMRGAGARLAGVAAERVTRELFLTLRTPASAPRIRVLDDVGALEAVLPEIGPMRGCPQNAYHHLDVWGHTLEALEHLERLLVAAGEHFGAAAGALGHYLEGGSRLSVLKLAVLLHDAGKPPSRSATPPEGGATFHGHDAAGAAMAAAAGRRLKLAARDRETLELLVRHHMHLFDLTGAAVGAKTLTRWFRRHGEKMTAMVLLYMADTLATRGPALGEAERERLLSWGRGAVVSYYGAIKARLDRKPLITGRDLAAMGMTPGPAMGQVLRAVREAQDAGSVRTVEESIALARALHRAGA
jgi:tRNA nucleotidyltransferase/poly(A) polymerase